VREAYEHLASALGHHSNLPTDITRLLEATFPKAVDKAYSFYDAIERDNGGSLPFRLQRCLTHCMERLAYDPVLYNGSERERAHFHSTSTSEASLWLHSLPRNPRDRLNDQELKTSYRLRLGIACAPATPTHCASCQRQFDELGDHALTCKQTARWSTTHNRIRDSLTSFLKTNDLYVQTEYSVARRDSVTRRYDRGSLINADHVVLIGDTTLWLDNSTVIPTSSSYRAAAARTRRAALRHRAREKHLSYDPHAAAQGAHFFALIHESGGAVNNEWHLLLKKLERLTDPASHGKLRLSYSQLMVSVSCITAKGNAHSITHSLLQSAKTRLQNTCTELRAH
jgi:hypothetical protein